MMIVQHAVLCTTGTRGDIEPFLSLGRCLQARGFKVRLLSNSNWMDLALGAGFSFEPIAPPDPPQSGRDDVVFFREVTFPSFGVSFRIVADMVHSGVRPLLMYRNNMLGMACAGRRFGLVSGSVCLQPSAILSRLRPAWPLTEWTDGGWGAIGRNLVVPILYHFGELANPYRRLSNQFRRSMSLTPSRSGFPFEDADFTVMLCADWFAMPQLDWPERCYVTGFPGPSTSSSEDDVELGLFLCRGAKPIAFTPGTGVTDSAAFFRKAVEASRRLGRRAILLSPYADPMLSDNDTLIRPYVNLEQLLPQCCAVVHHGGIGTVSQAIRAGTPQLVIPERFDQPDNAFRVAQLGLGGAIMDKDVSSAVWGATLGEILTNSHVRNQTSTAAGLIRLRDGAEEAVTVAEAFLESESGHHRVEHMEARTLAHVAVAPVR